MIKRYSVSGEIDYSPAKWYLSVSAGITTDARSIRYYKTKKDAEDALRIYELTHFYFKSHTINEEVMVNINGQLVAI